MLPCISLVGVGGVWGCWRLVVRGSLGDSRAPQSSPLLSVRGQRQTGLRPHNISTIFLTHIVTLSHGLNITVQATSLMTNFPWKSVLRTHRRLPLWLQPGSVSWLVVRRCPSSLLSNQDGDNRNISPLLQPGLRLQIQRGATQKHDVTVILLISTKSSNFYLDIQNISIYRVLYNSILRCIIFSYF